MASTAGCARCGEDARRIEVAVARRRWPDPHRLVRLAHVARVRVRVGVHRHGADAQAARGAEDAAGDLAAVGDQQTLDHERVPARLHAKYAEARALFGCVVGDGERERQDAARVLRIDDAIIPQPRRGVIRMPLAFVLLANGRA